MKIYDLSPEITNRMVVYKDKPQNKPKIKVIREINKGAVANESIFVLYAHTGSHVDAPYHFLNKGITIEKIDLEKFFGKCIVLDLTKAKDAITKNHLTNFKIQKNIIVLLKTKNKPDKTYNYGFTYIEKSAAEYLVSKKVKAVGLDNLSIERNQPKYDTHKILLRNKIPIFEGLDLSKVKQGRYFFYGFSLKIKTDGSPIRAVLIGK